MTETEATTSHPATMPASTSSSAEPRPRGADEGVLIVASGSSFHHFANFGSPLADAFDEWPNDVVVAPVGASRARTRRAPHPLDGRRRSCRGRIALPFCPFPFYARKLTTLWGGQPVR